MKRRNFLRAIGLLAAFPKVVAELNVAKPVAAGTVPASGIFANMKFVEPVSPEVFSMACDKSFIEMMKEMGRYREFADPDFIIYPKIPDNNSVCTISL